MYAIGREFLTEFATHLARRTPFMLSVTDRNLYLTVGHATLTTEVTRHALRT